MDCPQCDDGETRWNVECRRCDGTGKLSIYEYLRWYYWQWRVWYVGARDSVRQHLRRRRWYQLPCPICDGQGYQVEPVAGCYSRGPTHDCAYCSKTGNLSPWLWFKWHYVYQRGSALHGVYRLYARIRYPSERP